MDIGLFALDFKLSHSAKWCTEMQGRGDVLMAGLDGPLAGSQAEDIEFFHPACSFLQDLTVSVESTC